MYCAAQFPCSGHREGRGKGQRGVQRKAEPAMLADANQGDLGEVRIIIP